jgi:hypothetical protein
VAAVTRAALALTAIVVAATGCNNLQGFGGPVPPLVQFNVLVTGALPPGTTPLSLQVALVWGAQWLPEPFCVIPTSADIDPTDADKVIAVGCRDPLGFIPARVTASVPVTIGTPTTLPLSSDPSTDLLVGSITSRAGYASLVFYDDVDGDGTLGLSSARPAQSGGRDRPDDQPGADSPDIVYGASFLTMTAPDQRVAFLQGTFDPTAAFYPRHKCPAPDPTDPTMNTANGFFVLGASGFGDAQMALIVSAMGMLPDEKDPTQCTISPDPTTPVGPDGLIPAVISIAAQTPTSDLDEVSCLEQTLDGSVRYRQPPTDKPADFVNRTTACENLPSFGGTGPSLNLTQLVVSGIVSGPSTDRCKGLTHYTLRGCREAVDCAIPDWDFTASPPAWWPCNPP